MIVSTRRVSSFLGGCRGLIRGFAINVYQWFCQYDCGPLMLGQGCETRTRTNHLCSWPIRPLLLSTRALVDILGTIRKGHYNLCVFGGMKYLEDLSADSGSCVGCLLIGCRFVA